MDRMLIKTTLLAGTLAGALALTACGDDEDPAKPAADKQRDEGLAFARCMREQGIDMPDPQVSGSGRKVTMAVRIPKGGSRSKLDAAHKKCGGKLSFGKEAMDPREAAEARDRMVAFARCMRANGVDMPDPPASTGGMMAAPALKAKQVESARFQRAQRACDRHGGPMLRTRSEQP